MSTKPTWLHRVMQALKTAAGGMRLTAEYLRKASRRKPVSGIGDAAYFQDREGPVTISYPQERIPVPPHGRYRLFMETDDCIGCDKCARICPVDCITIETFRADGDLGKTSDGTVKRLHLPVFDIDMAKCMFCGLCTTVCPTECLIMTPVHDYSEFDRDNFLYHFGAYSPEEEARIRKETEAALAAKAELKKSEAASAPAAKKPVMRRDTPEAKEEGKPESPPVPRPLFRKPVIPPRPPQQPGADEKKEDNA